MPPEKRPNSPLYLTEPPRGMWYELGSAPILKFRARWRLTDGGKTSKGFESEAERAVFAEQWVDSRKEYGTTAKIVDSDLVRSWQEAELIAPGVDPVTLAKFYAEFNGVAGGQLTVKEAIKRFGEIRQHKKVSRDTKSHLKKHLERFAAHYGSRKLSSIMPDDIRAWLYEKLKNPDRADGKFAARSLRQHRVNVGLLFDAMVKERLMDRNPCEAVSPPEGEDKEKVILTPRQAWDYFRSNRIEAVSGPSAVECFGGLRFTSAARLTLDRIKDEGRGIVMPGVLHKTKKRKFRQGHPPNLWAWITAAPDESWLYEVRTYNDAKRAAFVRADMKPETITNDAQREQVEELRNTFRNSFASYLIALTKNVPLVSYLMQHSSTKITEVYEGVADESDARLYFSITPESVQMEWPAFVEWAMNRPLSDIVPAQAA